MSGTACGGCRRGPVGGVRAVPLRRGRRVLGAPGDLGQRARAQLRAVREQLAHVVHEERLRLGVALLVARAGAEHEQALGARRADVEQVALAVEPVLADRQDEAAGGGERAPVLVGQERLRRGAARELALLEPAAEDRLEAARPDRLRGGHLHAVGLRRLAHAHLELLEHAAHVGGVDGPVAQHRAQLGERPLGGAQGARLLELGAAENGRRPPVGSGEQRGEAGVELGRERRPCRAPARGGRARRAASGRAPSARGRPRRRGRRRGGPRPRGCRRSRGS